MPHCARRSVCLLLLLCCCAAPTACTLQPGAPAPSDDGGDASVPGDGSDANLAVFSDPDSEFSTTDVRDVDEEIVRFDATAKTLIWAADGSAFDDWDVDGNFLGPTRFFQVRFGTKDGERRAYFTETVTETICDIRIDNGQLRISATSVTVPQ